MRPFSSSELKTILHSKRANLYYLEHCRVLVNGGRVEYVTDNGRRSLYWNIPIANTTSILLGPGTSITQAAVRELGKAGVLLGFCGGGGTPLYSAVEICSEERDLSSPGDVPALWFQPQSEYRPTEYLQAWVGFWFNASSRLTAAKTLQALRLERTESLWGKSLQQAGFTVNMPEMSKLLKNFGESMQAAADITQLLAEEGRLTKILFKFAAQTVGYGEFTRAKRGGGSDPANHFLDHGNYLAYGLAAAATWVLGLPHGLAVLHGKTRRGGLVFDAADLIKDATILPQAFISAMRGDTEQEFRSACVEALTRTEALDFMIESLKTIAAASAS
ncbi:MAG: type I-F CRISPR-associated endonuclease Cas1f [Deltaproteobacteria bacterium]|jgi:CRISPR-associated protein Cas1|nr:type I-F CRISPR-associated endonuclease Cas1f [Deltaproteobacteria bacterium]